MLDYAASWPRCVSLQAPTAAKNGKFAHLVTLAKDRLISRWRSDLAQPNLDRNFGGRVWISRWSARDILTLVNKQSAELCPSHRRGHRGARSLSAVEAIARKP